MSETVLVTGGCGFIGRHVCRALLERGDEVRILDSFIDQVHGNADRLAPVPGCELVAGDVRDAAKVRRALRGAGAVIHLAAEVGVGQSMYEIGRYVGANDLGTAVLFDELVRSPVRRVVTASSMSIYGEGLYRDATGQFVAPLAGQIRQGPRWDPVGQDGNPLTALATPETKAPSLASVYALTKYVQERLTLVLCPAYGMEGVALRLFNVFGPGQALSNPYTGVLAIFAARLSNRQPPLVFEDGRQRRDFVHVEDVAAAFVLALTTPNIGGEVFNIASGTAHDVLAVARKLAVAMGVPEIAPEVLGKARVGDIRHCYADLSLARQRLGFRPRRQLDADTLEELAEWVAEKRAVDNVGHARRELEIRGLIA